MIFFSLSPFFILLYFEFLLIMDCYYRHPMAAHDDVERKIGVKYKNPGNNLLSSNGGYVPVIGSQLIFINCAIKYICISPRSDVFACGVEKSYATDRTVQLWCARSCRRIAAIWADVRETDGPMCFSPDGAYLCVIAISRIRVYSGTTGAFVMNIPHFDAISMAFDPAPTNAKYLLAAVTSNSATGKLTIWDISGLAAEEKKSRVFGSKDWPEDRRANATVGYVSNKDLILGVANGPVFQLDGSDLTTKNKLEKQYPAIADISANAQMMVSLSYADVGVQRSSDDTNAATVFHFGEHINAADIGIGSYHHVACSVSGQRLALAYNYGLKICKPDGTVLREVHGDSTIMLSMFAPNDEDLLYTSNSDKTVRLWNLGLNGRKKKDAQLLLSFDVKYLFPQERCNKCRSSDISYTALGGECVKCRSKDVVDGSTGYIWKPLSHVPPIGLASTAPPPISSATVPMSSTDEPVNLAEE